MNIIRLTESDLFQIIKESVLNLISPIHKTMLTEMATFGRAKWGRLCYKLAVHGAESADRPTPHIHIYYENETNMRKPQFNFEISLEDILTKDEINLIYQYDRNNHIKNTHRERCSWNGYREIYEGIKEFLATTPTPSRFGSFIDNLDRAIFEWNRETNFNKVQNGENPLKEYLESRGLKVLPKYEKYFE